MIQNSEKNYMRAFGRLPLLAACRFTTVNDANPTIVHSAGVESITWVSEGRWSLVLSNDVLDVLASGFPFAVLGVDADVIASDAATVNHRVQCLSVVESTGTIVLVHLSGAFAGPAALVLADAPGIDITVRIFALEA